jgi:hypothetical protein
MASNLLYHSGPRGKKNQAGGPKERQPGEGEREQDHLRHGSFESVSYFIHFRVSNRILHHSFVKSKCKLKLFFITDSSQNNAMAKLYYSSFIFQTTLAIHYRSTSF